MPNISSLVAAVTIKSTSDFTVSWFPLLCLCCAPWHREGKCLVFSVSMLFLTNTLRIRSGSCWGCGLVTPRTWGTISGSLGILVVTNGAGGARHLVCWILSCRTYPWNTHQQCHDDVIKWKHFPRCWPFVWGIHRCPVNSPHKGQWRGALMLSLICTRINGWVNKCEAGDLRRYRIHYDVTVMTHQQCPIQLLTGVKVTTKIPFIPLFFIFSELSKAWLAVCYHLHIWQAPPQLSCGDACQILMWFNRFIIDIFAKCILTLAEKLATSILVTPNLVALSPIFCLAARTHGAYQQWHRRYI